MSDNTYYRYWYRCSNCGYPWHVDIPKGATIDDILRQLPCPNIDIAKKLAIEDARVEEQKRIAEARRETAKEIFQEIEEYQAQPACPCGCWTDLKSRYLKE